MHRDIIFWSGIKMASRWGIADGHINVTRPMGAYQMAFWLRKHRFSAQVIEFIHLFTAEELVKLTEPFISDKTICIGLSRTFLGPTTRWPENVATAVNLLRDKFPHIKVVTGGQYGGFEDTTVKVDKTFIGYGEDIFLKWMQEQKLGLSMPNELF